jgi:3-hydroxyisobutyrate dehydrogenase-like beta-hydroxyacid dehydrogenase
MPDLRVLVAGHAPHATALLRAVRGEGAAMRPVEAGAAVRLVEADAACGQLAPSLRTALAEGSVDLVLTAFPSVGPLEQFVLGEGEGRLSADDRIPVIDFGVVSPDGMRRVAAAAQPTGVSLYGARLMTWRGNGSVRSVVYVDGPVLEVPGVQALAETLADTVIPVGEAKVVGLLADLLQGVNMVAVREALRIGQAAGVPIAALVGMLQRGSGASAMLDGHANLSAATDNHLADEDEFGRVPKGIAAAIDVAQVHAHPLFLGSLALGLMRGASGSHDDRLRPRTLRPHAGA